MSFSGDVKKELVRQIGSARHCQIAELAALLMFCATVQADERDHYRIVFRTEHPDVADKYMLLLKKVFHILPELVHTEDRRRQKTDLYQICVDDSETATRILQAVRFLDGRGNMTDNVPIHQQVILQNTCCRRAFIRGVFLAGGSVSDPNTSYHFEIVCSTEEQALGLRDILRSLDVDARTVQRKKYQIVYVKDSQQISDLLGMMGAGSSMLAFENARIVRSVRGDVNRQVNCETANISKTARAAAKQIADIQLIQERVGLANLPEALDEIARVRLQYPKATLSELGKHLSDPVGKSGVNHRLRKISIIAEALREKQGGNFQDG
ncbi:MAG: DNA-binding protein WhiA [Eubacterium sp.]|nr:DNA-binding protein WhiA [Eubacterium sp.]